MRKFNATGFVSFQPEYGQGVLKILVGTCAVPETLFDSLELSMFLYIKHLI